MSEGRWDLVLVLLGLPILGACSSSDAVATGADSGVAATSTGGLLFGGTGGASAGGGGAAQGGMAGSTFGPCPDLHTPPANCPPKVYAGSAQIGTQAEADALAGYTEIQGSVHVETTSNAPGVVNLDALGCLQTITYELVVDGADALTSLDGLRELTEVGGWVQINNERLAKLGCGLRKLTKVGTHSPTPFVEIESDSMLGRVELPLLTNPGHLRIDYDPALDTVVGSPTIDTVGQFFIMSNSALTSVSGFTGVKKITEFRMNADPKLPVCQAQAILNGLSAPPTVAADVSGDLAGSCP